MQRKARWRMGYAGWREWRKVDWLTVLSCAVLDHTRGHSIPTSSRHAQPYARLAVEIKKHHHSFEPEAENGDSDSTSHLNEPFQCHQPAIPLTSVSSSKLLVQHSNTAGGLSPSQRAQKPYLCDTTGAGSK